MLWRVKKWRAKERTEESWIRELMTDIMASKRKKREPAALIAGSLKEFWAGLPP
jgi:hypothetical protein